MTAIVDGELVLNEVSKNSNGGTEQMARRMANSIPKDLLSEFNIIHSRVRDIDKNKKNILVLHDLPNDPESRELSDKSFRDQFAKIVFVSNWQQQYYNLVHGMKYSESIVMKNAIEPISCDLKKSSEEIRLIYHTTPHRGLEILVPVFETLSKEYPNLKLDVYSSFEVYGWGERDEPYKNIFDKCKELDKITYHGAVSNAEVREALVKSHIFAYPSIWPETSCLAVIEAMSAKNIVVCPNYAALPETTGGLATLYPFDEEIIVHARTFYKALKSTIEGVVSDKNKFENFTNFTKNYTDWLFDWDTRKNDWVNLLTSLKNS